MKEKLDTKVYGIFGVDKTDWIGATSSREEAREFKRECGYKVRVMSLLGFEVMTQDKPAPSILAQRFAENSAPANF